MVSHRSSCRCAYLNESCYITASAQGFTLDWICMSEEDDGKLRRAELNLKGLGYVSVFGELDRLEWRRVESVTREFECVCNLIAPVPGSNCLSKESSRVSAFRDRWCFLEGACMSLGGGACSLSSAILSFTTFPSSSLSTMARAMTTTKTAVMKTTGT